MKNTQQTQGNKFRSRLSVAVVSVLSAMALSACGGGGSGSSGSSKPNSTVSTQPTHTKVQPANTWALQGVVVDNYGNGIVDADITLVLDNKEYKDTTDATGHYQIYLPKDYNYPEHFAGTVTKQNYVPTTIVFNMIGGEPVIKTETIAIRVIEDSDILFPASLQVHHLGDSSYTGSENSQFQYPNAHGKEWSANAILSDAQKAKYDQLCIQGSFKGVQRPNNIVLRQGNLMAVGTTSDTDPLGGYSELENCFDISKFNANQDISLMIKSVGTGAGSDIDDFEFVNLRGVLKNSGANHADTYNLAGMVSVGNGGVGMPGFKVSVVLDGVEYSSVTDSNGEYILHLPKNIKYPAHFAGIVTKVGYVPTTVIFSSRNNIPELDYTDTHALDLDTDYVAIPHSLNVVHLGDSDYGGSENSQFQYAAAHGKTWQAAFRLNNAQVANYSELCLVGEFKGVQYSNPIALSTDKEAKHLLAAVQGTANTPVDGSYSTLSNCFPLNKLPANQDIYVTIQSAKTGVKAGDYDDFEFVNLRGVLQ